MMKLVWCFVSNPNSLLAKVLRYKYISDFLTIISCSKSYSILFPFFGRVCERCLKLLWMLLDGEWEMGSQSNFGMILGWIIMALSYSVLFLELVVSTKLLMLLILCMMNNEI